MHNSEVEDHPACLVLPLEVGELCVRDEARGSMTDHELIRRNRNADVGPLGILKNHRTAEH